MIGQLIENGEIIGIDLGPNHGSFEPTSLDLFISCFQYLARSGRPVVLIMDDPLFAESQWDVLLKRVASLGASRGGAGVGVIAASPTFLMDSYGHTIRDRRIHLEFYQLESPTQQERRDLAVAFNREESSFSNRDDDFIVLAMEAATGISFNEIIGRIWETLNDGLAISTRARARDLPWTVRALMIVAFFHRYATTCPEDLLRASLAHSHDSTTYDTYAHELAMLQVTAGWTIFRRSCSGDSDNPINLVSTPHPLVAQRLWDLRPDRAFDITEWILPASVTVPSSAAHLAQVAEIGRHLSTAVNDHRLTQRLIEVWGVESVPTWQFCRLVRELGPMANHLTVVPLRKRWKRRDRQSWLAVWSLIHRARRGTPESDHLQAVDLPTCLRIADLSLDPAVAIKIGSVRRYRPEVLATLKASLTEKVKWRLDDRLLAWAIDNDARLVPNYPDHLVAWFGEAPGKTNASLALGRWYVSHARNISAALHSLVLDLLGEGICDGSANSDAVLVYIQLVELCARTVKARSADLLARAVGYIDQWANQHHDGSVIVNARLGLVPYIVDAHASLRMRILTESSEWLQSHSDNVNVRNQFLEVVSVLGARSPIPLGDVLADVNAWLQDHPDDVGVRKQFLRTVSELGARSPIPLGDVLTDANAWLQDHPDDVGVRKQFLYVVSRLGARSPIPLGDALADANAWFQDHPDDVEVRKQFLRTVSELGARSPIPLNDVLADVNAWLQDHPDDVGVRKQFLRTVSELGARSPIPLGDVLADANTWLQDHPADAQVRKQFLHVATTYGMSFPIPLIDVVTGTQVWLRSRPNNVDVRKLLLQLVSGIDGATSMPLAEALTDTHAWLRSHFEREVCKQFLSIVAKLGTTSPVPLGEVVYDIRGWLEIHPDETDIRNYLITVTSWLGAGSPVPLSEVLADTHAWLRAHPEDSAVRKTFLSVLASPENRKLVPVDEVVTDTQAWLEDHTGSVGIRKIFLTICCDLGEASPIPFEEILNGAEVWLEGARVNSEAKEEVFSTITDLRRTYAASRDNRARGVDSV
ncbi:hypothetical protein ACFP2T_30145 [Plantactinospora solaniradicis]|uniref:Uncharacterized protein n=1 Tax=Plantactinospora solaniradicis TaxID=1723736 RepID=A0ABW1KHY3_9ACTN